LGGLTSATELEDERHVQLEKQFDRVMRTGRQAEAWAVARNSSTCLGTGGRENSSPIPSLLPRPHTWAEKGRGPLELVVLENFGW